MFVCSKCRKSLPEENLERKVGNYHICLDCRREDSRYRYQCNREKILEQANEYYRNNTERCKHNVKIYQKKNGKKRRRKFSTNRKIKDWIMAKIRGAIFRKDRKYIPSKKIKYLGCSVPEYLEYLRCKFQEGMTWENRGRGGWHIDHIIPLKYFDLTKEEDKSRFFHYTNTQPLWWWQNSHKRDKLDCEIVTENPYIVSISCN
jgi:hypothetical protein